MSETDPTAITDPQIRAFCASVRGKKDWIGKILDVNRDLARKWATEAGFIQPDGPVEPIVDSILNELKAEAKRIQSLDGTVRLTSQRLPERSIDFETIDRDVAESRKYARLSQYGIRKADLRDDIGVYVSDGIVPKSLHEELVTELNALASLEPKDFHPGTYGKVQDLIHPSLYPYVADATPLSDGVSAPALVDGKFETTLVAGEDGPEVDYSSKFSWIPSLFCVNDQGSNVNIASYINGLGSRERFSNLYRLIEQVFVLVIPHFEKTLEVPPSEFTSSKTPSAKRWKARKSARQNPETTQQEWDSILARDQAQKEEQLRLKAKSEERLSKDMQDEWDNRSKFGSQDDSETTASYSADGLKVIVKAANYILRPGQEYEGSWHLEGMPHERIVASAIYYYDSDPAVIDAGLSLRRLRDQEGDFPSREGLHSNEFYFGNTNLRSPDTAEGAVEDGEPDRDYPSDWEEEMSNNITLGTVATSNSANEAVIGHGTGRILSFPNWIQHKVTGLKHYNASEADALAQRKILCFFLVDDEDDEELAFPGFTYEGLDGLTVLTTMDIPSQERQTNVPTLRVLIAIACRRLTRRILPANVVDHIVWLGSLAMGISREMAEQRRREFMDDRRMKSEDDEELLAGDYSLCEH